MTVRSFRWRDLPILLRYRNDGLFFDSALQTTRGTTLIPAGALFSYLAPATGLYTYVETSNGQPDTLLIGQVSHPYASPSARLTYITPQSAMESDALARLLEQIIAQVAERGALRLLAEVPERSFAFQALREAGFAIYARQRLWQLSAEVPTEPPPSGAWRILTERDTLALRSLYYDLIPGLVQQVEPLDVENFYGLIYDKGECLAYVELKYGWRGIWVQPFIHPDVGKPTHCLRELIHSLPYRLARPIYLCIRSYQAWLEPALEELGGEPTPDQAVMVKHLAVAKKVAPSFGLLSMESGRGEISAPLARTESETVYYDSTTYYG